MCSVQQQQQQQQQQERQQKQQDQALALQNPQNRGNGPVENASGHNNTQNESQGNLTHGPSNPNDVLLGRGKGAAGWIGNQRYRHLIRLQAPAYKACQKNWQKIELTKQIVADIQSKGGRFLRYTNNRKNQHSCTERVIVRAACVFDASETFELVPDNVARTKVGQALRHWKRSCGDSYPSSEQVSQEGYRSLSPTTTVSTSVSDESDDDNGGQQLAANGQVSRALPTTPPAQDQQRPNLGSSLSSVVSLPEHVVQYEQQLLKHHGKSQQHQEPADKDEPTIVSKEPQQVVPQKARSVVSPVPRQPPAVFIQRKKKRSSTMTNKTKMAQIPSPDVFPSAARQTIRPSTIGGGSSSSTKPIKSTTVDNEESCITTSALHIFHDGLAGESCLTTIDGRDHYMYDHKDYHVRSAIMMTPPQSLVDLLSYNHPQQQEQQQRHCWPPSSMPSF